MRDSPGVEFSPEVLDSLEQMRWLHYAVCAESVKRGKRGEVSQYETVRRSAEAMATELQQKLEIHFMFEKIVSRGWSEAPYSDEETS